MEIRIRTAAPEDYPSILALITKFAAFQKTPEKVTITLEQMQQEKDCFHCLLAETPAFEIVGFASFFFAYYSWSGKAVYLDDLYVKEQFRKRQVGSQLLNAVISLAEKENCKKLRWQVSSWNKDAINFYRRIGASIDNVEINCDLLLPRNTV
jgi:GNAT superfamily N-acetyltransferase